MRQVIGLAGVAVCLLATPAAQPQQPAQPTFRATTQYVAVDVVVTDSSDRVVTDLTKDDFTITEKGQPQTIEDFSFVSVPLESRTIDLDVPPPPPSDVGSNASQPRASRALAFVIDDQGLRPQDLIPLRRAMVQFLQQLSSDDQVAMTYISHSNLSQDFTNDIGRLIETVKTQKESLGLGEMSRRTPGREKMFVLENAQRAGVPIYTLDPRLFTDENFINGINTDAPGATAGESGRTPFGDFNESMRILATETGGRGFSGMSDVPRAVREILIENGSYYLLGFYPKPLVNDGKFHDIEVKVRRPGLTVRARKGYSADPATPKATTPKRDMTASLGAGLDDPSLPIRAFVAPMGASPRGTTRTVVTIELAYPLPEAGATRLNDELRVGILALTPDAKIKASFQRPIQFSGTWNRRPVGRS